MVSSFFLVSSCADTFRFLPTQTDTHTKNTKLCTAFLLAFLLVLPLSTSVAAQGKKSKKSKGSKGSMNSAGMMSMKGKKGKQTLTATGFVKYSGYQGFLEVSGTVGPMTTIGTTQSFGYQLAGVDNACQSGAGSAPNSCGIHIHVGTSCTSKAGAHYFTGSVTTDPWTSITYNTNTIDGTSTGTESVDTGGSSADVSGRTIIIHNWLGGRIACAILEQR
ncbi:hypothetical protein TrVE_jg3504 [Triparma verrucosa]|uniref:Superoxide dismutase copper/zinc binding domain-containing protein n=1 Tax=Triparma verrucosa TaxID=1606542 RepID=A0A9W7B4B1_9STRA|nr:hypothetical protein TrVE_jg3504 [Triparma verrucosa]